MMAKLASRGITVISTSEPFKFSLDEEEPDYLSP